MIKYVRKSGGTEQIKQKYLDPIIERAKSQRELVNAAAGTFLDTFRVYINPIIESSIVLRALFGHNASLCDNGIISLEWRIKD